MNNGRHQAHQLQVAVGILPGKGLNDILEGVQVDLSDVTRPKMHGICISGSAFFYCTVIESDHFPGNGQEDLALHRQGNVVFVSDKKGKAQLFLQFSDLLGYSGLRNVEFF